MQSRKKTSFFEKVRGLFDNKPKPIETREEFVIWLEHPADEAAKSAAAKVPQETRESILEKIRANREKQQNMKDEYFHSEKLINQLSAIAKSYLKKNIQPEVGVKILTDIVPLIEQTHNLEITDNNRKQIFDIWAVVYGFLKDHPDAKKGTVDLGRQLDNFKIALDALFRDIQPSSVKLFSVDSNHSPAAVITADDVHLNIASPTDMTSPTNASQANVTSLENLQSPIDLTSPPADAAVSSTYRRG